MLKRKSKMRTVVISITIYFFILLNIFIYTNLAENSKVHASDLNLVGKTVNQAENILETEGYRAQDYVLITTDGSQPGKNWKIEKVKFSKKIQLFIQQTELPNISTLHLVGMKLDKASEKLEQYGYNQDVDYKLINNNDETIFNRSKWEINRVVEKYGEITKVHIERIEKVIPEKELNRIGQKSLDKNVETIVKELHDKKWTNDDYKITTQNDKDFIFIQRNWIIASYEIENNKLIFTAIKKTS